MPTRHTYSRDEIAAAVASAHSWRGVLRALGRSGASAGTLRAVRRQVDALGVDHSHFTGQRRWTDRQLIDSIAQSASWSDVLERLGLSAGGRNLTLVRARATRLGIETTHLVPKRTPSASPFATEPQVGLLRTAGANLAAAWFLLRGHAVLWPLEPCRYDFVVRAGHSFERIQVKTTSYRAGPSSVVSLSNSRRGARLVYDMDEIDAFFVIDAELNAYLIPIKDVAGYQHISLRGYRSYLVAEGGQWLRTPAAA